MMRPLACLLLGGLLLGLSACGNKGPLYLPKEEAAPEIENTAQENAKKAEDTTE
jgi:predicted small lipoprotein YifL